MGGQENLQCSPPSCVYQSWSETGTPFLCRSGTERGLEPRTHGHSSYLDGGGVTLNRGSRVEEGVK